MSMGNPMAMNGSATGMSMMGGSMGPMMNQPSMTMGGSGINPSSMNASMTSGINMGQSMMGSNATMGGGMNGNFNTAGMQQTLPAMNMNVHRTSNNSISNIGSYGGEKKKDAGKADPFAGLGF